MEVEAGVGGDKGGPLGPEVEDVGMALVKVLGYEPRLCLMLTSGEPSAFTQPGAGLWASSWSSHPFFV